FFTWNACMRHGRRMPDQAFNTSKAFCQGKKPGGRKHFICSFHAVIFERETHHSAKSPHLLFGNCMIGMVLKSTPYNLINLWILFQPVRDLFSILAVTFHSYV